MEVDQDHMFDLLIIGGGINGVGIARDAAGRGLSVALAEKDDLASATSSASTKMFHGGLRYLEFFKIRLVRESLIEREVLLRAMPHISWPMRFVLPLHKDMRFESETPTSKVLAVVMPWMRGRRPDWLIRLGLFLYDSLGGRKILPPTQQLDLRKDVAGAVLKPRYTKAFEYSDCWVEDARLVALNARDAEERGATVLTRTEVVKANAVSGAWRVTLQDSETGDIREVQARMVVNAAGPWVAEVLHNTLKQNSNSGVRLVRGSHIVTHKLFEHDKCYFFQGSDGRIIFAIPYETDFTLIGTTDAEHPDPDTKPECSAEEAEYLMRFASEYFAKPVTQDDVVWSYSGVRPLYDDGASSATAATRDYVLQIGDVAGAPVLNVFGGKITTYRRLAEAAMDKIAPVFDGLEKNWTAGVALAGGDFAVGDVTRLIDELARNYPFLGDARAKRFIRAYGTDAAKMLQGASSEDDLGRSFGAGLTEREVRWLMRHEYARRGEDVVWRRSKLGLRMSKAEIAALDKWMIKEGGA